MLAEWTIFTQVSGVQWCPRSSRQVAADDLRPVHAIVVAGRAARPLQRAHPLRALLLPSVDERVLRRRRAHGGGLGTDAAKACDLAISYFHILNPILSSNELSLRRTHSPRRERFFGT